MNIERYSSVIVVSPIRKLSYFQTFMPLFSFFLHWHWHNYRYKNWRWYHITHRTKEQILLTGWILWNNLMLYIRSFKHLLKDSNENFLNHLFVEAKKVTGGVWKLSDRNWSFVETTGWAENAHDDDATIEIYGIGRNSLRKRTGYDRKTITIQNI